MEEKTNTIDEIRRLHEGDPVNFSQSKIAQGAGISPATLSRVLGGNYEGSEDNVTRKLDQFLRIAEMKRKSAAEIPFVETENAKVVMDVCQYAMTVGAMCMITGPAGTGKTIAIQEFERRNDNVILIYISGVYMQRSILIEIARRLKIAPGSVDVMLNKVVDALKGSNKLIIVDEAQKIFYRSLELFREIHDMADVGVVLCGSKFLYDRVTGQERLEKDLGFDQMYSRIQRYHHLKRLPVEDIVKIIAAVFGEADDDLGEHVHRQTLGSARNLRNVIKMARVQGHEKLTIDSFDLLSKYVIMAA